MSRFVTKRNISSPQSRHLSRSYEPYEVGSGEIHQVGKVLPIEGLPDLILPSGEEVEQRDTASSTSGPRPLFTR